MEVLEFKGEDLKGVWGNGEYGKYQEYKDK